MSEVAETRWVDFHNHVIPGVDDGAADPETARAAVEKMRGEGVETIVATPHVDGSLSQNPEALDRRLGGIDRGWERLLGAVPGPDRPRLLRGAEVKLDVPQLDLTDPRLRLGGGAAVLVEFAFMTIPPRADHTLARLREAGYLPVLAHPERYHGLGKGLQLLRNFTAAGAFLQVNTGSLLGVYGKQPRQLALEILERGWAHCLSSDYHARGAPRLREARQVLERRGGHLQARVLLEENPSRLLRGEPCIAVAPLERPSALDRVRRRWFGGRRGG